MPEIKNKLESIEAHIQNYLANCEDTVVITAENSFSDVIRWLLDNEDNATIIQLFLEELTLDNAEINLQFINRYSMRKESHNRIQGNFDPSGEWVKFEDVKNLILLMNSKK